jgi:3-methylfumaryl-CoA hydratase
MASNETASLKDWIGRTTEVEDLVTSRLIASLHATLSQHAAALRVPLGLHWCLAPDIADAGKLGADGHPARGGFLPPVPLPRRMWAASDVRFLGTFASGDRVTRRSTVSNIEEKRGRSGLLVFVTVRHEFRNATGLITEEDQTIVYREESSQGAPDPTTPPPLPPVQHERNVEVDPVLLFRYSALTFNGHRIHYDAPYVMDVEHYPGLVIHGPLQATLLLNFAAIIHGRPPQRFSFRGVHPATGTQKLSLRATHDETGGLTLEVQAADGHVTVKASAQW